MAGTEGIAAADHHDALRPKRVSGRADTIEVGKEVRAIGTHFLCRSDEN